MQTRNSHGCCFHALARPLLAAAIALAVMPTALFADEDAAKIVASFRLPDTNEKATEVAPQKDAPVTVVCFLGTECPLAKLYAVRLNEMAQTFTDRGVRFFGVNSNRQDSLDEIRAYAEQHAFTFPLLKDYQNKIADQLGAKRTPEVFVLDDTFAVRYHGRIDNQYQPGVAQAAATKHELRDAIDALLAGKPISPSHTEPEGCLIGRVRQPDATSSARDTANDVTYCKQVARILQTHCVECHRSGEIGPFVLDDYDEVAGWADMMLEVIDEGRMPPWHANPDHGEFANARHMPGTAKETLKKWVDAGTPYGDAADLPAAQEYTQGWRLPREPDLVVEMGANKFDVPAEGTVDYQYFVVDPGLTEEKWVAGAEVIPGNRSVVHHSIVFVRPPDGEGFRGLGWIAAYVPGQQAPVYPLGTAQRVPAGSKFVFQQHYTPNGSAQDDKTKIGLIFTDEAKVTHETYTIIGIDQQFEIPPKTADHKVHARVWSLPKRGSLLAFSPHMHLRGKSFQLFAHKDKASKLLVDVPNYDFNWQHTYALKKPIPLTEIDRLEMDFVFDNSDANAVNPNANEFVMWGDQTYEEMAVAFFQVSEPRPGFEDVAQQSEAERAESDQDKEYAQEEAQEKVATKTDGPSQEVKVKMAAAADEMLAEFDKNKDGEVSKSETPWVFRRYQFGNIDQDDDAVLSRDEIEEAARWRVR